MKNLFISFEGGEGCGKSTHSKLLQRYLEQKGFKVVLTLEPGGTEIGKALRKMLLRNKSLVSRYAELFLFAADRMEHVERIIKPSLKAGKIVISDRFIDSTTAYQAGGRKLPRAIVSYLNKVSSCAIIPDITILLDIPPRIGIKRGTEFTGKDKFESQNGGFHERVRRMYLKVARQDPVRIKKISSMAPLQKVQQQIRGIIDEKLGN